MGWLGAVFTALVGAGLIVGSFSAPLAFCPGWRDAFLIDGILCFPIAWAEADDEEGIAVGISAIAIIIFAVWAIGFFYGPFTC